MRQDVDIAKALRQERKRRSARRRPCGRSGDDLSAGPRTAAAIRGVAWAVRLDRRVTAQAREVHLMRSFKYLKYHIEEYVLPEFEQFGEVVLERIAPVFDAINQEATDLEKRRFRELMSAYEGPDDWSAGEGAAELAFKEASNYARTLSRMKFATLNLFAAGLYHLSEQHIIDLSLMIRGLVLSEGGGWVPREEQPTPIELKDALCSFEKETGLKLNGLASWQPIRELKMLANLVKHGEAGTTKTLRQLQPHLFVEPAFRTKNSVERNSRQRSGSRRERTMRVRKPLFGQDFYVTPDDFAKYHQGSIAYWTDVAAQLGRRR